MSATNLVIRSRQVGLTTKSRVHTHNQQQIEVAHHLFRVGERRRGIEREPGQHAALLHGVELALHVNRGFGMKREHRPAGGSERVDVMLGLYDHQVHVDRPVGQFPERLDHVGPERDVRDEAAVHDVHVQPIGAGFQDLRDLILQPCQIGGQHARRDPNAVVHWGLRATTISTTVPGAASVPAAGLWATTVPGDPSLVRRLVTVPSCSPWFSSFVRASADAMPKRSGTAMVGAPRLITTVRPAPGASAVPAGGRVIIARPVGDAAWTDSTWLTTNPAAATIDCANAASSPATSGTGILGGPALVTRVTFVPSGATTSAGGSCQITVPCGAVGCGSAPPSVICSLSFWISACASGIVSPSTRGTAWCPGRIGAGKRMRYAVR